MAKVAPIFVRLPQDLPQKLVPWFLANQRDLPWRKDKNPYHIWLSEIMLQQTRVEAVKGYYTRFLSVFPTVEALANGEEEMLLKCWEGLGYYNRARNLQKAAKLLSARGDKFPQTVQELKKLPGIGDYTAGAIASIAFEQPTPAVDGNVLRVIARLATINTPIESSSLKQGVSHALQQLYPQGQCGAFTQSLMELGATVCVPNGTPLCTQCPLQQDCMAYQQQVVQEYPKRSPKRKRKQEEKTVFLLVSKGRLAIEKRTEKSVLSGLWQLPNVPNLLPEDALEPVLAQWNLHPEELVKRVDRTHIFTHIQWHMWGYVLICSKPNESFCWVTRKELEATHALPTAFRKFLQDIPSSEEW